MQKNSSLKILPGPQLTRQSEIQVALFSFRNLCLPFMIFRWPEILKNYFLAFQGFKKNAKTIVIRQSFIIIDR